MARAFVNINKENQSKKIHQAAARCGGEAHAASAETTND